MPDDRSRIPGGAAAPRGRPVDVFTDGACSGNPGPGGWAYLLRYGEIEKAEAGGTASTTNNRMELTAAVEALRALTRPCAVRLHSDSAYLVNAFREDWLGRWKRNGWRNAGGDPVSNADLWTELDRLAGVHRIEWIKVKGHSDHVENERCDRMAVEAMRRYKPADDGNGKGNG